MRKWFGTLRKSNENKETKGNPATGATQTNANTSATQSSTDSNPSLAGNNGDDEVDVDYIDGLLKALHDLPPTEGPAGSRPRRGSVHITTNTTTAAGAPMIQSLAILGPRGSPSSSVIPVWAAPRMDGLLAMQCSTRLLQTLRKMLALSPRAQHSFFICNGFARLVLVLASLKDSGLLSPLPSPATSTATTPIPPSTSVTDTSTSASSSQVWTRDTRAAAYLVQEVMLTLIAALKSHAVARRAWQRDVGWGVLHRILVDLPFPIPSLPPTNISAASAVTGVTLSPTNSITIEDTRASNDNIRDRQAMWLLWLGFEFEPTSTLEVMRGLIAPVDGKAATISDQTDYNLVDTLMMPLPDATCILINPGAIWLAIRLLPDCTLPMQSRILLALHTSCNDSMANRSSLAAVNALTLLCRLYRNAILDRNHVLHALVFAFVGLLAPITTTPSSTATLLELCNAASPAMKASSLHGTPIFSSTAVTPTLPISAPAAAAVASSSSTTSSSTSASSATTTTPTLPTASASPRGSLPALNTNAPVITSSTSNSATASTIQGHSMLDALLHLATKEQCWPYLEMDCTENGRRAAGLTSPPLDGNEADVLAAATAATSQNVTRGRSDTAGDLRRSREAAERAAAATADPAMIATSIELPAIPLRSWPPNGYTFAAWIYIDSYGLPTTLPTVQPAATPRSASTRDSKEFGSATGIPPLRIASFISDDNQSVTDIYIEDGMLVVRTSNKALLRFPSMVFSVHRWYHIALTHSKAVFSGSTSTLYINGRAEPTAKLSFVNKASSSVRAYIGSAPIYAAERSSARWRLASCCLIEEVLTEPVIKQLFASGPFLSGLVAGGGRQPAYDTLSEDAYELSLACGDALDSVLTHVGALAPLAVWPPLPPTATSATGLPMSSPSHSGGMTPSSRQSSSSPHPLRHSASRLLLGDVAAIDPTSCVLQAYSVPLSSILPAEKIVFFFHARHAHSDIPPFDFGEHSLRRQPLPGTSHVRHDWDISNPSTFTVLVSSGSYAGASAIVHGAVRLHRPQLLADAIRPIGGVRTLLPLIGHSHNGDTLFKSLVLLGLSLRRNPKNMRDMAATSGYHLMAHAFKSVVPRHWISTNSSALLAAAAAASSARSPRRSDTTAIVGKTKLTRLSELFGTEIMTPRIAEVVLSMVGLTDGCMAGRIANLPAFEALIMDYRLWSNAALSVQLLIFQGIINSILTNENKEVNMAALHTVRVVPWLLSLVSDQTFPEEMLPHAVTIIRALLMDDLVADELQLVTDFALTSVMVESTPSTTDSSSPDSKPLDAMPALSSKDRGGSGKKSSSADLTGSAAAASLTDSALPSTDSKDSLSSTGSTTTSTTDGAARLRLRANDAVALRVQRTFVEMILDLLIKIKSLPQGMHSTNNRSLALFLKSVDFNWIFCLLHGGHITGDSLSTRRRKDPEVAMLALKILLTLLEDPLVAVKFRTTLGFDTLSSLLVPYWETVQTHTILLAMLLGRSIHDVPTQPFDSSKPDSWSSLLHKDKADHQRSSSTGGLLSLKGSTAAALTASVSGTTAATSSTTSSSSSSSSTSSTASNRDKDGKRKDIPVPFPEVAGVIFAVITEAIELAKKKEASPSPAQKRAIAEEKKRLRQAAATLDSKTSVAVTTAATAATGGINYATAMQPTPTSAGGKSKSITSGSTPRQSSLLPPSLALPSTQSAPEDLVSPFSIRGSTTGSAGFASGKEKEKLRRSGSQLSEIKEAPSDNTNTPLSTTATSAATPTAAAGMGVSVVPPPLVTSTSITDTSESKELKTSSHHRTPSNTTGSTTTPSAAAAAAASSSTSSASVAPTSGVGSSDAGIALIHGVLAFMLRLFQASPSFRAVCSKPEASRHLVAASYAASNIIKRQTPSPMHSPTSATTPVSLSSSSVTATGPLGSATVSHVTRRLVHAKSSMPNLAHNPLRQPSTPQHGGRLADIGEHQVGVPTMTPAPQHSRQPSQTNSSSSSSNPGLTTPSTPSFLKRGDDGLSPTLFSPGSDAVMPSSSSSSSSIMSPPLPQQAISTNARTTVSMTHVGIASPVASSSSSTATAATAATPEAPEITNPPVAVTVQTQDLDGTTTAASSASSSIASPTATTMNIEDPDYSPTGNDVPQSPPAAAVIRATVARRSADTPMVPSAAQKAAVARRRTFDILDDDDNDDDSNDAINQLGGHHATSSGAGMNVTASDMAKRRTSLILLSPRTKALSITQRKRSVSPIARSPTSPAARAAAGLSMAPSMAAVIPSATNNTTATATTAPAEDEDPTSPSSSPSNAPTIGHATSFEPPRLVRSGDKSLQRQHDHDHLFSHPLAVLSLHLIRWVVVHNLKTTSKGCTFLEELLEQSPINTTTVQRVAFQSALLASLTNHMRTKVTVRVLLARPRLADNFVKVAKVYVAKIKTGYFSKGTMMTLHLIADILSSKEVQPSLEALAAVAMRRKATTTPLKMIQPLITLANELLLMQYAGFPVETSQADLESLNTFVLDRQSIILGDHNSDRTFITGLCHHLYAMITRHATNEALRSGALRIWSWLVKTRLDVMSELLLWSAANRAKRLDPKLGTQVVTACTAAIAKAEIKDGEDIDLLTGGFDQLIGGEFTEFNRWCECNAARLQLVFDHSVAPLWEPSQLALFSERVAGLSASRTKQTQSRAKWDTDRDEWTQAVQRLEFKLMSKMQNTHKQEILRRLRRHQNSVDRERQVAAAWRDMRSELKRTDATFAFGDEHRTPHISGAVPPGTMNAFMGLAAVTTAVHHRSQSGNTPPLPPRVLTPIKLAGGEASSSTIVAPSAVPAITTIDGSVLAATSISRTSTPELPSSTLGITISTNAPSLFTPPPTVGSAAHTIARRREDRTHWILRQRWRLDITEGPQRVRKKLVRLSFLPAGDQPLYRPPAADDDERKKKEYAARTRNTPELTAAAATPPMITALPTVTMEPPAYVPSSHHVLQKRKSFSSLPPASDSRRSSDASPSSTPRGRHQHAFQPGTATSAVDDISAARPMPSLSSGMISSASSDADTPPTNVGALTISANGDKVGTEPSPLPGQEYSPVPPSPLALATGLSNNRLRTESDDFAAGPQPPSGLSPLSVEASPDLQPLPTPIATTTSASRLLAISSPRPGMMGFSGTGNSGSGAMISGGWDDSPTAAYTTSHHGGGGHGSGEWQLTGRRGSDTTPAPTSFDPFQPSSGGESPSMPKTPMRFGGARGAMKFPVGAEASPQYGSVIAAPAVPPSPISGASFSGDRVAPSPLPRARKQVPSTPNNGATRSGSNRPPLAPGTPLGSGMALPPRASPSPMRRSNSQLSGLASPRGTRYHTPLMSPRSGAIGGGGAGFATAVTTRPPSPGRVMSRSISGSPQTPGGNTTSSVLSSFRPFDLFRKTPAAAAVMDSKASDSESKLPAAAVPVPTLPPPPVDDADTDDAPSTSSSSNTNNALLSTPGASSSSSTSSPSVSSTHSSPMVPMTAGEVRHARRPSIKELRELKAARDAAAALAETKQELDLLAESERPPSAESLRTMTPSPEPGISEYDGADESWLLEEERLQLLLQPGDTVQYHYNCLRVEGLDEVKGILIMSTSGIYIVDNYEITADAEIVKLTKEEIYGKNGSSNAKGGHGSNSGRDNDNDDHESRRWIYSDVREVHKRRYLLRPAAIELFFSDGTNHLLVLNVEQRDQIWQNLVSNCPAVKTRGPGLFGSEADSKIKQWLKSLQQRWSAGQMSNFEYLMHLNSLAGRSYNDLTQYPVFPWIVADYDSEYLDLDNLATFRDLTRPMGGLSEPRAHEFRQRFLDSESFNADGTIIPRFHYGTHYSSAAAVLYYLVRLEPFTQHQIALQSGRFDHPDRLFQSLKLSWLSASRMSTSDVKELIPEFFYFHEFLVNANRLDLGRRNRDDSVIDHVLLPPWCRGSAREFVRLNRRALESDYVSANLHHWIDLIFGWKQQGQPAIDAQNVFYYLTYAGQVDIDKIADPIVRRATIEQIRSFGQTPKSLFHKPHPPKATQCSTGDLYQYCEGLAAVADETVYPHAIGQLGFDASTKITVVRPDYLLEPQGAVRRSRSSRVVGWGFVDGSVRVGTIEASSSAPEISAKYINRVYLNMHDGIVRCAAMSEEDFGVLVTGGDDGVVCVWHKTDGDAVPSSVPHSSLAAATTSSAPNVGGSGTHDDHSDYELLRSLHGHSRAVTCVVVSKAYSIILSGSEDHTVIMWDLNRLVCVRQFRMACAPITSIAINPASGDCVAITRSPPFMFMFDINGAVLASYPVTNASVNAAPLSPLLLPASGLTPTPQSTSAASSSTTALPAPAVATATSSATVATSSSSSSSTPASTTAISLATTPSSSPASSTSSSTSTSTTTTTPPTGPFLPVPPSTPYPGTAALAAAAAAAAAAASSTTSSASVGVVTSSTTTTTTASSSSASIVPAVTAPSGMRASSNSSAGRLSARGRAAITHQLLALRALEPMTSVAIAATNGYEMDQASNLIVTGHSTGMIRIWQLVLRPFDPVPTVSSVASSSSSSSAAAPSAATPAPATAPTATPLASTNPLTPTSSASVTAAPPPLHRELGSFSAAISAGLYNGGGNEWPDPQWDLIIKVELKHHTSAVTALTMSSDGNTLYSGDSTGHVATWTVPLEYMDRMSPPANEPCACKRTGVTAFQSRGRHTPARWSCPQCSHPLCDNCRLDHLRTHPFPAPVPPSHTHGHGHHHHHSNSGGGGSAATGAAPILSASSASLLSSTR